MYICIEIFILSSVLWSRRRRARASLSRLASSVSQQQPGASSSQSSAAERHQAARTQSHCSRKPGGLDLENKSIVEFRWVSHSGQWSVCTNAQHFQTSSHWSVMSLFPTICEKYQNEWPTQIRVLWHTDVKKNKTKKRTTFWVVEKVLRTQYHPLLNSKSMLRLRLLHTEIFH